MSRVEVVSFGYGHGPAPDAHATFDVRAHFRDPHIDPALRDMTAADAPVAAAVLGTAGIPALISSIAQVAAAFLDGPQPGPVTVAVGCAGGRHRSAVIAAGVARRLGETGVPVALTHRDITKPVIRH